MLCCSWSGFHGAGLYCSGRLWSASVPFHVNWGASSDRQPSDVLSFHLNGTHGSDTANHLNAWHFFHDDVRACMCVYVLFCLFRGYFVLVLFSERRKKGWGSDIDILFFFSLRLSNLMVNYEYFLQNITIFPFAHLANVSFLAQT